MSYALQFFNFSKRRNSTKRPTENDLITSFNAEFMDESGILSPTFKVSPGRFANTNVKPHALNYARVPEFNRYYYITNWKYDRGLWYCEMLADVLASYKTAIGATNTYILRSASNVDRYIVDNMYPVKVGATFNATTNANNPFATAFSSGWFVIGVINGDAGGMGAVSYYVFTNSQFRTFCNTMMGNISIFEAQEISTELMKALLNPFQYVVSCTWMPVQPPLGATLSGINIGWWTIPCSCARLSGYVRTSGSVTITIPRNPEINPRAYLQSEPYTQYYLDFPPFGNISIPANYLVNTSYIDFQWDCDCITGSGKLSIGAGNGAQPFNILHGQIGVPVQMAQMIPNIVGQIQQSLPATGNAKLDSIIESLGNLGGAYLQSQLPMQSVGSNGGFMEGYYPIRLTGIFFGVAPENLAEFGAPCCRTLTINTLSGYVQCAHGDFSGNCTVTEIEEINSYMTSGFFYE